MVERTYSTGEVAKSVDPPAHNTTVVRYEQEGRLGIVKRNKRGQRRFSHSQKKRFQQLFNALNR